MARWTKTTDSGDSGEELRVPRHLEAVSRRLGIAIIHLPNSTPSIDLTTAFWAEVATKVGFQVRREVAR